MCRGFFEGFIVLVIFFFCKWGRYFNGEEFKKYIVVVLMLVFCKKKKKMKKRKFDCWLN